MTSITSLIRMARKPGELVVATSLLALIATCAVASVYFAGGLWGWWRVHPWFNAHTREAWTIATIAVAAYFCWLVGWRSRG